MPTQVELSAQFDKLIVSNCENVISKSIIPLIPLKACLDFDISGRMTDFLDTQNASYSQSDIFEMPNLDKQTSQFHTEEIRRMGELRQMMVEFLKEVHTLTDLQSSLSKIDIENMLNLLIEYSVFLRQCDGREYFISYENPMYEIFNFCWSSALDTTDNSMKQYSCIKYERFCVMYTIAALLVRHAFMDLEHFFEKKKIIPALNKTNSKFRKSSDSNSALEENQAVVSAYIYKGLEYERAPRNVEEAIIDENVTVIHASAFRDCTHLRSIVIPQSVKRIEGDAFSGCSSLEFVGLINDLEFTCDGAFTGCNNLKSVSKLGDKTSICQHLIRSHECFEKAAGIYHDLLGDYEQDEFSSDFDFTPSCLSFLECFMLACGQSTIFHLAQIQDIPQARALAKISIAASEFFERACGFAQMSDTSEKISSQWMIYANRQHLHFRVYAEYYASVVARQKSERDGVGLGIEIARLNQADFYLNQSEMHSLKSELKVGNVLDVRESLKSDILQRKISVENANLESFMESIPSSHDLRPVIGSVLVNPTPSHKWLTSPQLPLQGLFNAKEYHVLHHYCKRLKKEIELTENREEEWLHSVQSELRESGISRIIATYSFDVKLPNYLINNIKEIQNSFKVEELEERFNNLRTMRENSRSITVCNKDLLDFCAKEETKFKNNNPKHNTTGELKTSYQTLENRCQDDFAALKGVANGDEILSQLEGKLRQPECMYVLQTNCDDLETKFYSLGFRKVQVNNLDSLRLYVESLFSNSEERLRLVRELSITCQTSVGLDNFLNVLCENPIVLDDVIHQNIISPFRHKLETSYSKDVNLLKIVIEMALEAKLLVSHHQELSARDDFLEKLEQGISIMEEITTHLPDGESFYESLLARLHSTREQIEAFSVQITMNRSSFEDAQQIEADRAFAVSLDKKVSNGGNVITNQVQNRGHDNEQPVESNNDFEMDESSCQTVSSLSSDLSTASSKLRRRVSPGTDNGCNNNTMQRVDEEVQGEPSSEIDRIIARLVEMGFTVEASSNAMRLNNNNEHDALVYLLQEQESVNNYR